MLFRRFLGQFRMVHQMLIWLFLVAILPLLLISIINQWRAQQILQTELTQRIETIADFKVEQIESYLGEVQDDVTRLAQAPESVALITQFEMSDSDPAAREGRIAAFNQHVGTFMNSGSFYDLFLINPAGQIQYTILGEVDLGTNLNTGPFNDTQLALVFTAVSTSQTTHLSNFAYYEPSEQPAAFVAAPIMQDGQLMGVLAGQISNTFIHDVVLNSAGMGDTGETIVAMQIDDEVLFMAPTRFDPTAAFGRQVEIGAPEGIPVQNALLREAGNDLTIDYRGERVVAAWRYLPSLNWGLVVKIDASEAFAPMRDMTRQMIIVDGLILAGIVVIGILIARSYSLPLQQVTAVATAISKGNISQPVLADSNDEIGDLSRAFAQMTTYLTQATQQATLIAQGDFDRDVQIYGANDSLNTALQEMTLMLRQIRDVAQTVATGNLRTTLPVKGPNDQLAVSINEMIKRMQAISLQAQSIAQGDYSVNVQPRSKEDQLGQALQTMVNNLRQVTAESERQLWLANGRSGLNQQISNQLDLPSLARQVVSYLCRYLELPIGALYVNQGSVFQLMGSYAYQRRRGNQTQFPIGEGMVGQAALEKQMIWVSDLPDDYLQIQSASTASSPAHILLLPLLYEDNVEAVLEVGNFSDWPDETIHFLHAVSDTIALAIFLARHTVVDNHHPRSHQGDGERTTR